MFTGEFMKRVIFFSTIFSLVYLGNGVFPEETVLNDSTQETAVSDKETHPEKEGANKPMEVKRKWVKKSKPAAPRARKMAPMRKKTAAAP